MWGFFVRSCLSLVSFIELSPGYWNSGSPSLGKGGGYGLNLDKGVSSILTPPKYPAPL